MPGLQKGRALSLCSSFHLANKCQASNQLIIDRMIFFIIIPLLFWLSDAAPVADDQAFSHPLQKRAPDCDALYGSGIVLEDCRRALGAMRGLPPDTLNPQTGRVAPRLGAFNRFNPDGNYRLPQQFKAGTCTILVDMTDPAATVTSGWSFVSGGAYDTIMECVDQRSGIGGELNSLGFNTVVLNEQNLDPAIRQAKQHCISLIEMQHHMDSFSHCLLNELATSHKRPSLESPRRRGLEHISDLQSLP